MSNFREFLGMTDFWYPIGIAYLVIVGGKESLLNMIDPENLIMLGIVLFVVWHGSKR